MNRLSLWGKAATVGGAVGLYGVMSHLAFVYFVQGGMSPDSWASLLAVVSLTPFILLVSAGLEFLWLSRFGHSLILRPAFVFAYCILIAMGVMLWLLLTGDTVALAAPNDILQWLGDHSIQGVATLVQLFVSLVSYAALRDIARGKDWRGNQPGY